MLWDWSRMRNPGRLFRFAIVLFALLDVHLSLLAHAAAPYPSSGRKTSFNAGWRFYKGEASGAENPQFDDSEWQRLDLPHDWAIEEPFDPTLNPETGALRAFGTGWYRKTFTLPPEMRGKHISVEFDGAMSNSQVWINGHSVGGRPYGYIGFALDLTPYLKFGDDANVLAVRLTPEKNSSRWYPGAGIYRNVWLEVTGDVRVAHWGTYVTTPEITNERAKVAIRSEIVNQDGADKSVTVRVSILDPNGKSVGQSSVDVALKAGETRTVSTNLEVRTPLLWDIDHPYLYAAETEVRVGQKKVDSYLTPFGIRTIAFDANRGFLLNGRHLKIHGVCDHHDLGALGTAVNRRAIERQLEILKGAGVNAIRTSHNPPAPELLDLTDKMGLLVMDEAFDVWEMAKVENDYSKYFDAWSERDARDMVRRDRNHPSIILWSIGNEVLEQGSADGARVAHRLVTFFHEEDPTRPTTAGFNRWEAAIKNGLADEVDAPGFNYQPTHYAQILREHPKWKIFGSETESCVSSRGVYRLPIERYEKDSSLQLSSYDILGPPWAYCPDVEFTYQDELPQVLGEFVWTGFDYIGEPTPYFWSGHHVDLKAHDWPARSSYFGMVDLAGFPKDRYYLYQSEWTTKPMVHLLPHWNWPGREGQKIPVMVYSNAEDVELFLNGRSLGKKARYSDKWEMPASKEIFSSGEFETKYRRIWQVPYEPGTMRAVAYHGGKQVAVDEVRTAGPAAKITMKADRVQIAADGSDLAFVTVRIEDKDGNLCPEADNLVHFDLEGPGTIAGVDNGNPATVEPFHADHRKAFSGMALVIIRSVAGKNGTIRVRGSSAGLEQGGVVVRSEPVKVE
jgi:beta-galactosidase